MVCYLARLWEHKLFIFFQRVLKNWTKICFWLCFFAKMTQFSFFLFIWFWEGFKHSVKETMWVIWNDLWLNWTLQLKCFHFWIPFLGLSHSHIPLKRIFQLYVPCSWIRLSNVNILSTSGGLYIHNMLHDEATLTAGIDCLHCLLRGHQQKMFNDEGHVVKPRPLWRHTCWSSCLDQIFFSVILCCNVALTGLWLNPEDFQLMSADM